MKARVDTHIRLHDGMLPAGVVRRVVEELTVANPDYDAMRREHVWGWQDVPKTIELWEADGTGGLILPRGFGRRLVSYIPDIDWEDARRYKAIDTSSWPSVSPKGPHQKKAMETIFSAEQGIVQMPPGSGKTVAVLDGIRRAGQRALVIVDKTHIAAQWRERCRQFLGFEPGMVGEGVHDESDKITIAMQQTLWSRADSLPQSFWEGFGFVCLDECHHAAARTYYDILQRFPAAWRIGVSATPRKSASLAPFVDAVLGETVLAAPSDDVVVPTVIRHFTDFEYLFWPTHQLKPSGKCGFAYCTRTGKLHRNNYSEMVKALQGDRDRNLLIARQIARDVADGRATLVVSDRLGHLKELRYRYEHDFWDPAIGAPSYMLTGEQGTDERMDVYARVDGPCVVFSTVADEALDIPRLDSIHLVWPGRNTENVKQRVGRVLRTHPAKSREPLVNDYVDYRVPLLRSQARDREFMYVDEGYRIS